MRGQLLLAAPPAASVVAPDAPALVSTISSPPLGVDDEQGRLAHGATSSGDCFADLPGSQRWARGQLGCYIDGRWANIRWTHEELLIYAGGRWKDVSLSEAMAYWFGAGPE